MDKKELEDKVVQMLKSVYDPEIPVDIYELGLIYDVIIKSMEEVEVLMTLTSPSCPVAETLPVEVEQRIKEIEGIDKAEVKIVWDPPWEKDMMSDAAKVELGLM